MVVTIFNGKNDNNNENESTTETATETTEATTQEIIETTAETTQQITQPETSTKTETTYKTNVENKINEEIENIEKNKSQAWRRAYIEFLDNRYYAETECEKVWLGYLDDDDIPELFVSTGSFHFCTVKVYTFMNNNVTFLCETGSNGVINYFERQGIICGYYYGMGIGDYWVYSFEDGKIQQIYQAISNEEYISEDGEEFEIEISINGVQVSSEEFDEFLDYYFNTENSTWIFNDYEADYSEYRLEKNAYTKYINNF